ncbi:MAG: hypothetical protein ISS71_00485 [Phycisphaerae bacterium]|nr:hypothetical protein [Phycisphaerae bacterium]
MLRKRSSYRVVVVVVLLYILCTAYAWIPLIVSNDPLVRMPGSQPAQGIAMEGPNRCLNCHANYVDGSEIEPGDGWKGTMMSQAARDPIYWACLTVAGQDSVWALGNANAVDLCERCHFPGGWLGGRSDPPNVSAMTGDDFDGIYCDFCHRMYDPFYETTYNGTREGSDWTGYWNEATSFSQTSATTTYTEDRTESAGIKMFNGTDDFYTKTFVPRYGTYTESGSGQFYVASNAAKRASFADAQATHQMLYSRYHKSKYMCGTCHDVSNPVLTNLGLSGLSDQSNGAHLITEQYSAFRYFHVERTFSEFMLSTYSQQGGAATNPEFAAASGGIDHVAKCQDCHMFDVVGKACNKSKGVLRPTESTEHPAGVGTDLNSGLPMHDLTGGNVWISHILASLDPAGPVYDPVNVQILDRPIAEITLDLNAGQTPKSNGALVKAGSDRAKDQLRMAATIKNLSYDSVTGALSFRVQNNTGHKLISGFPEGRRMFISIEAYRNGANVYKANPYDYTVGTLKGLSLNYSPNSPTLESNEHYVDELVYEIHPKSDLTGEDETFHFVLATGRYKDNRIPPKGFNVTAAAERISIPVWHGIDDPNYFTADEYAGGYDGVELQLPTNCDYVNVELFYQGTSREYVEFLRDEINGTATTLASPTPSGETQAYIIQTDPFFAQLRVWGDIIWDLWFHNHGLDGSGVEVDCIVPFEMTSASWGTEPVQPDADLVEPWGVDLIDFAEFSRWWQRTDCAANNNCNGADFDGSGDVDLLDLAHFAEYWLWGKTP